MQLLQYFTRDIIVLQVVKEMVVCYYTGTLPAVTNEPQAQ